MNFATIIETRQPCAPSSQVWEFCPKKIDYRPIKIDLRLKKQRKEEADKSPEITDEQLKHLADKVRRAQEDKIFRDMYSRRVFQGYMTY